MKITFNWIRGDDEFETLIITDDNDSPVDLSGSRFDLHIVPDKSAEVIKYLLQLVKLLSIKTKLPSM